MIRWIRFRYNLKKIKHKVIFLFPYMFWSISWRILYHSDNKIVRYWNKSVLLSGIKKNDFLQIFFEETRRRALILQNKKKAKNDFYVYLWTNKCNDSFIKDNFSFLNGLNIYVSLMLRIKKKKSHIFQVS